MRPFLLLPFLFAASAAPAQPALPTEKWIVDWGEQRCSLVRRSSGENPVTMVLRASLGSHRPELVLQKNWAVNALPLVTTDLDVLLTPIPRAVTGFAHPIRTEKGERLLMIEGLAEDFFDQFASSTGFTVQRKGKDIVTMRYPIATAAIRSLRTCNDDLLASWGVDPKLLAALSKKPKAIKPETWITNADYPDSAIRARESGSVVIRFMISADGAVSDCVPMVSSGAKHLDELSCELFLKRARYEPALDSEGRPVPLKHIQTIHWALY